MAFRRFCSAHCATSWWNRSRAVQAPGPPATSAVVKVDNRAPGWAAIQPGSTSGVRPSPGPRGSSSRPRNREVPWSWMTHTSPLAGTTFVTSSKTAGCPAVRNAQGLRSRTGRQPRDQPAGPAVPQRQSRPRELGVAGQFDEPGGAGVEDPRLGPPDRDQGHRLVHQHPAGAVHHLTDPGPEQVGSSPGRLPVDQRHGKDVDLTRDHKPAALVLVERQGDVARQFLRRALTAKDSLDLAHRLASLRFTRPPRGGLPTLRLGPSRTPDQATVEPPGAVKSVVGTTLNDPALTQDDDLVAVPDGTQAVGNDEAATAPLPEVRQSASR